MDSTLESMTIDQAIRHHAQSRPNDLAVVDPRYRFTWAEFDEEINRAAHYLAAQGVGAGDRVGWYGPNSAAYPVVLMATWRLGAAIVGMNWRLPASELANIARKVELKHLVTDFRFAQAAEEILPESLTVAGPGDLPWAGISDVSAPDYVGSDDDLATIFFTSGSTGLPKVVPLHRGAVEATMIHAEVHAFEPGCRALIVPPVFHAAGGTWTNYALKEGATTYYSDAAAPADIIDALVTNEISHTILVPTLIHAIVAELGQHPREFPHLKHIGYGASPITPALLEEALNALKCDFSQVYGMSETGGGVTLLWPEDHVLEGPKSHRLRSAGRPSRGVEVEVRDEGRNVLPQGETGDLWFKTECLTRGYLYLDDPSNGVLVDGWLNTRDVGYLDEDGYIYTLGRSDDVIQSGAENIHPLAVEEVILQMDDVDECVVFGVPHERWGQEVCAAIVSSRSDLTQQEVADHCRGSLAGYQIPKRIILLDSLPRTATGKPIRSDLVAKMPQ